MDYFYIIVGFAILLKGADVLVSGASDFAKKLGIPPIIIGLTIVAFGTSAPELFVNISAALGNNTDLALGNIVGSNIINILLILGISCIVNPVRASGPTIRYEIPLTILAGGVLAIMTFDAYLNHDIVEQVSRGEGIILILFFLIFLAYTIALGSSVDKKDKKIVVKATYMRTLSLMALGLASLIFGSQILVYGAQNIAISYGLSQHLIGLTIIAIGTSLPELATSAVAAYRKNMDISIGNIIGSNIFNIFFILGVTSVITQIPVGVTEKIDIIFMLFVSIMLFVFLTFFGKRGEIGKLEGIIFISSYIFYVTYLVQRG